VRRYSEWIGLSYGTRCSTLHAIKKPTLPATGDECVDKLLLSWEQSQAGHESGESLFNINEPMRVVHLCPTRVLFSMPNTEQAEGMEKRGSGIGLAPCGCASFPLRALASDGSPPLLFFHRQANCLRWRVNMKLLWAGRIKQTILMP
jgi:hypothetical protein